MCCGTRRRERRRNRTDSLLSVPSRVRRHLYPTCQLPGRRCKRRMARFRHSYRCRLCSTMRVAIACGGPNMPYLLLKSCAAKQQGRSQMRRQPSKSAIPFFRRTCKGLLSSSSKICCRSRYKNKQTHFISRRRQWLGRHRRSLHTRHRDIFHEHVLRVLWCVYAYAHVEMRFAR